MFQPKSEEARKRWGFGTTMSEEEAIRELGNDRTRAFLHKVFNSVIQGTAADQTKHAIVDMYEDHGVVVAFPVHDEINMYGDDEDAKRLSAVMENAMSRHYGYEIPFIADAKLLNNWGEAK
jgi:DNA polymerase I-like protein with 3'-5' exonuclease and polymerase domains